MNDEMNRIVQMFLAGACCCLFAACDTATPQTYFDVAVLNCNLMHGFAGSAMQRQLESPSVRLSAQSPHEPVAVKRKEIIDEQITRLESGLKKIKDLKQTDDNREMLQASIALYEFVLPVYRNEYQQLAKLYDESAAPEQIESLSSSIATKYGPGFGTLFDQLMAIAKPYAARHDIKVQWDIKTEPSL